MVVENVRGAQPWVGRSRWNYGSFHLWGDVPALMPVSLKVSKVPGFRFDGRGTSFQQSAVNHLRDEGIKQGGDWFNKASGNSISRRCSSKSKARKRAAAVIAKIPLALSRHIARVYHPKQEAA